MGLGRYGGAGGEETDQRVGGVAFGVDRGVEVIRAVGAVEPAEDDEVGVVLKAIQSGGELGGDDEVGFGGGVVGSSRRTWPMGGSSLVVIG